MNTDTDVLDVCMPTWNSGNVIQKTLECLKISLEGSTFELNELIIIDNHSRDRTKSIINQFCAQEDWDSRVIEQAINLPNARQLAIELVNTEWFLFLDDDVRIRENYLNILSKSISPIIGAIQGRKLSNRSLQNSKWLFYRARRGGTHATLIRTASVNKIEIPNDLVVLEDEFIRRHIEDQGYIWMLNHQAYFTHDTENRHSKGWTQGYLGGKYDLLHGYLDVMLIPYMLLKGRSPIPYAARLMGWIFGKISTKL